MSLSDNVLFRITGPTQEDQKEALRRLKDQTGLPIDLTRVTLKPDSTSVRLAVPPAEIDHVRSQIATLTGIEMIVNTPGSPLSVFAGQRGPLRVMIETTFLAPDLTGGRHEFAKITLPQGAMIELVRSEIGPKGFLIRYEGKDIPVSPKIADRLIVEEMQ